MLPVTRVRIVGPSMAPAMLKDEWWVVRRTSRVRPGDVALMTHPDRPDLLIVKRLVRREDGGWWVLGDNPDASDDPPLIVEHRRGHRRPDDAHTGDGEHTAILPAAR